MADILQVIKKAAVDAVNAENPTQLLFGFVESLDPFKIRISQKILLDEKFIILGSTVKALRANSQLNINDRLLVIREQGGQKYLALDIIPNEAWLPEYDAVNNLRPELEQIKISIEENDNGIRNTVARDYVKQNDFTTYKSTVSEQTDEKITFKFNESTKISSDISEVLESEIQERKSYINFEDGAIELGRTNNNFKAVLDNTALRFKENGQDVAYISNQALNITNANIMGELKVGNFRWQVRSNGNLSLVKI